MTTIEEIPAGKYLKEHHVPFALAAHREAFTAGAEARALGLPADDVLKIVILKASGNYVMAVVPASMDIDMDLAKKATGDRFTRLATEDEISESFEGYQLGALPALPGLLGVPAYVDPAVFDHDSVAFADGRQTESLMANPREMFWGEAVFVVPLGARPEIHSGWWLEGDAVTVAEE